MVARVNDMDLTTECPPGLIKELLDVNWSELHETGQRPRCCARHM